MVERGWLDLDSRKGKAPGGYQETFSEERRPFIFMNAVGTHRDLDTMLHEAGHAFHAFACRSDPLVWYRSSPLEFAEVASMGMELLAAPHLTEFYSEPDRRRAMIEHLEGIVHFLPYMAIIDEFQDGVYTRPQMSPRERRALWVSLMTRYGGIEDWIGLEDIREVLWHRQLHPFTVPFYYVEYGIAQLGALQLWAAARRDAVGAVKGYKKGLALGGSRPLPELFSTAGLRFDFTAATLNPLVQDVLKEVEALSAA
jgi:oligoendopeptidase F